MMKKMIVGCIILLFLGSSIPAFAYSNENQAWFDKANSRGYNIGLNGTIGTNGWYVGNVTVTITGLQGNESVFYSVDYARWQSYHSPIMVSEEGSQVFIAVVIDQQRSVTLLKPVTIQIDKTPPELSLNVDRIFFRKVKYSVSAYDKTSGLDNIEFQLASALKHTQHFYNPFGTQSASWILRLFQVPNHQIDNITVTANDLAGNVALTGNGTISRKSQSQSIPCNSNILTVLENNLPQHQELNAASDSRGYNITLQGGRGNNGWFVTPVVVNVTGSQGNCTVRYNLDFGQWQTYTSPLKINKDGNHTFIVFVLDQDGNVTILDPVLIKIDRTMPYCVLNRDILLNRIKYTAVTQDNISGIDRVEFWIGPFLQYTNKFYDYSGQQEAVWILHPIPRCNLTVETKTYDLAGNMIYCGICKT